MISVVIPTLNSGETLAETLSALVPAAVSNLVREVVIVDGGSSDETLEIADDAGARVIAVEPGPGRQLAAGCAAAKGPWLLVLNADTRLSPEWEATARDHIEHHAREAGYFRFALDDHRVTARLREAGAAMRSGAFGPQGVGQGLLLSKRLYDEIADAAPVEGAALVRRLGRGRLRPLAARALNGRR